MIGVEVTAAEANVRLTHFTSQAVADTGFVYFFSRLIAIDTMKAKNTVEQ